MQVSKKTLQAIAASAVWQMMYRGIGLKGQTYKDLLKGLKGAYDLSDAEIASVNSSVRSILREIGKTGFESINFSINFRS